MKLSPDSPELTAYALGELPPGEHAAVEAALAAAPELRAEVAALQRTIGELGAEFAAETRLELAPEQRAAIVGQATRPPAPDWEPELTPPTRRAAVRTAGGTWLERLLVWRQQLIWMAVGACALALTLAYWLPQRDALEQFSELRYQRLPAPKPTPEVAPITPLTVANTPVAPPVAEALGRLETSGPTAGLTPRPKAARDSAVVASAPGGKSKSQGLAPDRLGVTSPPGASAPVSSAARPEPQTRLANRYGLAPRPASAPAVAGQELADQSRSLAVAEANPGVVSLGFAGGVVSSDAAVSAGREERHFQPRPIPPLAPRYPQPGGEGYEAIADNDFKSVSSAPLSTFSLDVDTASYANARRFLREGSLPPRAAVRLEELINYFHYDYPQPKGEHPFLAAFELAESPWKEGHKLVRLGLQAKAVDRRERPAANLVFLVDVSGSMGPENKLPLVQRSLRLLLDKLTDRDRVGIVTYAGESRVAAEPTRVDAAGKTKLTAVIEGLRAGSGTHGSAGIQMAYAMATNQFNREHVNRVILCTDGDFNVGITDRGELLSFITERAQSGVFLSVLGYGMGNYQDGTMELLADQGNGHYAYVDSFTEARKVLSEQLEGTLVTVAKDVKVQVEFNPARVKSYRLLGYENRALRDRDFNDDSRDAGEVGAGHQITVLYEIEPAVPNLAGVDPLRYQGKPAADEVKPRLKSEHGDELLNLKLRYKLPAGETSRLMETPLKDGDREFAQASSDFKFAAAVAGYGMLLRQSPHRGELTWEKISRLAEQGLGEDKEGYRAEFVDLVRRAQQLGGVMPVPMLRR
jgi:secreted protein with Ig-like and vWFA domain